MAFTLVITRADDWTTSYDVWAKHGSIPLEEGDGEFVGNYPIAPDETYINEEIAYDDTYGFLVLPIRRRSVGVGTGYIA